MHLCIDTYKLCTGLIYRGGQQVCLANLLVGLILRISHEAGFYEEYRNLINNFKLSRKSLKKMFTYILHARNLATLV